MAFEMYVDEAGVPYSQYGVYRGTEIGIQRSVLAVAERGLWCWNEFNLSGIGEQILLSYDWVKWPVNRDKNPVSTESARAMLTNCADWLMNRVADRSTHLLWCYDYPLFYGVQAGWGSAHAQAVGLQLLLRASRLHDGRYAEPVEGLLKAFDVRIEDGGLLDDADPEVPWFEKFASPESQRPKVLNGMMFALLGLHDVAGRTGLEAPSRQFDVGLRSVLRMIARYDLGDWSAYDIQGKRASSHYHSIHIAQLDRLFLITGDRRLAEYRDRFASYRAAAPRHQALKAEADDLRQEIDKLKGELRAVRNSLSYRLGNLLVEAAVSPGRNTVFLPYRLGRLAWSTLRGTGRKTATTLSGIALPSAIVRLEQSQWFSLKQLEELQNQRLQRLVAHAYANVPYYREVFDEHGLKPKDIQTREDLQRLPVLTKDIVRTRSDDMRARNWANFQPNLTSTSGSTRQPLSFYVDRNLSTMIDAVVLRHRHWCGLEDTDRSAVLRGTLIDEFGTEQQCHWKIKADAIHFSTFQMTREVAVEYLKQLNEFRPALMRGYPASLEILAQFIKDCNLRVHSPKAVITNAEVLWPQQRQVIEEVFRAPVFDWWGHGERTVNAGECERHEGLHLNCELGIAELVKTERTKGMKDVYSIVSTSLWNHSMPFIRYDTEDLAVPGDSVCSCGRGLPLIKRIIGREGDIIEGINGVRVSPRSFSRVWRLKVFARLPELKYSQIVQTDRDRIKVRLVAEKNTGNESVMREWLNHLLGPMKVEFEYLPAIPSGQKWRFTVSELPKAES